MGKKREVAWIEDAVNLLYLVSYSKLGSMVIEVPVHDEFDFHRSVA